MFSWPLNGKTYLIRGLQGKFAAADATGNLNLVSVSAANAVRGMVVGDLTGGGFVLSGSGVEVSGAILTATYRVNAGAVGSYSLPITIDAAMMDGVPVEDEMVMAFVNVAKKATPEPVAPAPTQENNVPQKISQGEPQNAASQSTTPATANDAASTEVTKTETAAGETNVVDEKTEAKQNENVASATKRNEGVPSANRVLSATTTTENIVTEEFNPVGVIAGVMAAIMGVVLVGVILVQKKKSTLRSGQK